MNNFCGSGFCGSGFWGGQRPSLAHYVTGMGPMDGATAAGGRSCCLSSAAGNVSVPAGAVLFVAPEMVAHYVEKHGYLPPQEFVEAVLAAPLPGTPSYTDAVEPFVAGSVG